MKIVGIDVGGTKILGVLADEAGAIVRQVRCPTVASEGPSAVINRIVSIIQELSSSGVDAVGIGMPGPLDPVSGIVYDPPNLPGWKAVPLLDLVRQQLGASDSPPVAVINDANAAALAEFRFGAGTQGSEAIKHLVYLTISTGVGGGVVVDGRLLLGANGLAAELGHIVINAFGPRCPCGNIGCLEAMASGSALAREGYMVVKARRQTAMSEMAGHDPEKVTAEIVVEAARAGDPAAVELMQREGMLVGVGVVSCIHAFNPQLVVLGGGVTNAGDLLFDPVRATVADRIMPAYRGTYKIVPAGLGGESGALGAVAAALTLARIRN